MNNYTKIIKELEQSPKTWLVTGAAGFIGSHLVEKLLQYKQRVVGLDNLTTGNIDNLQFCKNNKMFSFIKGDVRDLSTCIKACESVDYIFHHAAIGSVLKSIEMPILVDQVNSGGFINILEAANEQEIKKIVYASSSAIYGEKGKSNKKTESDLLDPLSPYAASKCSNEYYAAAFSNIYDFDSIGLRYFNIYGSRQDPNGDYAAVIPKWINAMLSNEDIEIFGDGTTIRDFCHIDDVVQANILAAISDIPQKDKRDNLVYNVASGCSTTLNELFDYIKELTSYKGDPIYKEFRSADIKISQADISKIQNKLGFKLFTSIKDGLASTINWYKEQQ